VAKYFSWFKTKLDTVERLYCAVFWPAAIDKPDDYQVAAAASAAYRQNAGFDVNKDGMITRAEICRPVKAILAASCHAPQDRYSGDGRAVEGGPRRRPEPRSRLRSKRTCPTRRRSRWRTMTNARPSR